MAKRLLTTLRLVNLSSDPESASNGDIYYNSSTHKTKIYTDGIWLDIPNQIDDLSNVSVSAVSNGQVLTYNGTTSEWEAKSSPPSATATGTEFPLDPSSGEFFFNTVSQKLYFYYDNWNEITFTEINLDGGTSSTLVFDGSFSGGSSSTTQFGDGTYDGGDSSTTY